MGSFTISCFISSGVITTSSWRVGKEAILRELGPNKIVVKKKDTKLEGKNFKNHRRLI